jgi:hypothetical protein
MKAIRSKYPIRMVRYSEGGPADRMMSDQEREEAEMRLAVAAAEQQNRFVSEGEGGELRVLKESDPLAAQYIEQELFENVGFNPEGGASATEHAWSAATVSDLATAFDPSFEGSARHSDYIRRAFQDEGNYKADKINNRTDFRPGDILFKGRTDSQGEELGPQKFREFRRDAAGKGKFGGEEGYGSHSDIIVSTGTDKGGTYYIVQGGNVSDGLYTRKMYAKELADRYAGRLTQ